MIDVARLFLLGGYRDLSPIAQILTQMRTYWRKQV